MKCTARSIFFSLRIPFSLSHLPQKCVGIVSHRLSAEEHASENSSISYCGKFNFLLTCHWFYPLEIKGVVNTYDETDTFPGSILNNILLLN